MNMLMHKIGERNFCLISMNRWLLVIKATVVIIINCGCLMTRSEGDRLFYKVSKLENEVAKLQSIRHDIETVFLIQMKDLIDRMAKFERQLATFRQSQVEDNDKSKELIEEIKTLRALLEESQRNYQELESAQENLLKNQHDLKEAQQKIRIPVLKEDHFAEAKKYFHAKRYDDALYLLEQFIKTYGQELTLIAEAHVLLGDVYDKQGELSASLDYKINYQKKAVVSYQKAIATTKDNALREEVLFKMGNMLKAMGNKEGALAAFEEILAKHKNTKRAQAIKKMLAELIKK